MSVISGHESASSRKNISELNMYSEAEQHRDTTNGLGFNIVFAKCIAIEQACKDVEAMHRGKSHPTKREANPVNMID